MKFINYLQSITGIGIFPMISLLMFFTFFTLVTLYVIKVDKKYIDYAKNVPFEN